MQNKPPRLLLILGILTIINTGIASLSGFAGILTGPPSLEQIKNQDIEMAKLSKVLIQYKTSPEVLDLVQKFQFLTKALNENYILFTSVSTLISLSGLISIMLMFKRNMYGFHLYIIYCLMSSTSMYLIVSPEDIPTAVLLVNLITSCFFIFLYSKNINWLKFDTSIKE